jgi:hypothetical protein
LRVVHSYVRTYTQTHAYTQLMFLPEDSYSYLFVHVQTFYMYIYTCFLYVHIYTCMQAHCLTRGGSHSYFPYTCTHILICTYKHMHAGSFSKMRAGIIFSLYMHTRSYMYIYTCMQAHFPKYRLALFFSLHMHMFLYVHIHMHAGSFSYRRARIHIFSPSGLPLIYF